MLKCKGKRQMLDVGTKKIETSIFQQSSYTFLLCGSQTSLTEEVTARDYGSKQSGNVEGQTL